MPPDDRCRRKCKYIISPARAIPPLRIASMNSWRAEMARAFVLRMGCFHGASPRVKGYKKGCEHIVTYKAIWLALYSIPIIALALCMLQKRKTLVKRYRHKKSGCVVCIPDFVAVLGATFAAAASQNMGECCEWNWELYRFSVNHHRHY